MATIYKGNYINYYNHQKVNYLHAESLGGQWEDELPHHHLPPLRLAELSTIVQCVKLTFEVVTENFLQYAYYACLRSCHEPFGSDFLKGVLWQNVHDRSSN